MTSAPEVREKNKSVAFVNLIEYMMYDSDKLGY